MTGKVLSDGIFIDDAGTPGVETGSGFLHQDRKSWAGVIVPEDIQKDVDKCISTFLEGVHQDYGANELHFPEIYGGRGVFKDVEIGVRYELLELMARIFGRFQIPIVFQTCSARFLKEIRERLPSQFPRKIDFLDLERHDHLTLFFLLTQIRDFIGENGDRFPRSLPVYVDEGIVKAGAELRFESWKDMFEGGRIRFQKSHLVAGLQLADFAAFVIGRTQWLQSKSELKPRDKRFLEILSDNDLFLVNLPKVAIDLNNWSNSDYDEYLRLDRIAKGLPEVLSGDDERHE